LLSKALDHVFHRQSDDEDQTQPPENGPSDPKEREEDDKSISTRNDKGRDHLS